MDPSADLSQIGQNGAAAANPSLWSNFMGLFGQGQQNGQPTQLPGAAGIGQIGVGGVNSGLGAGLGMNIGTGQLALGALGTLGNLWTAWNANKLAQQSFQFNKTLASDNYTNQATSYNTNLTGMEAARASMENLTPDQVAAYDKANSLKTIV